MGGLGCGIQVAEVRAWLDEGTGSAMCSGCDKSNYFQVCSKGKEAITTREYWAVLNTRLTSMLCHDVGGEGLPVKCPLAIPVDNGNHSSNVKT